MATTTVPFAHTNEEAKSSKALSETVQLQASIRLVETKIVPFGEDLVHSQSRGLNSVELNKTNLEDKKEKDHFNQEHEEEREEGLQSPIVSTTVSPQESLVLASSSQCKSSTRCIRPRPRPLRTTFEGEGPKNLRQIFDRILIQQIAVENWTRKHLVLVGNQQPLEKALSRINSHNIHSLPVLDEDSKSVIGLLDVMEILRVFHEVFKKVGNRANEARWIFLPMKIKELMKTGNFFLFFFFFWNDPNLEHRQPTYVISTHATLYDGVRHLPHVERRRLMIVERPLYGENPVEEQKSPEDTVTGLLAPLDILRFLAQNVMWMKQERIFQRTIGELGLGRRTPHMVSNSIPAWQGFVEIYEKRTDSVAVVDENGKFVANLSACDIKGITRRNFQLLSRSLSDFLARDQNRGWWALPICVQDDEKLENVILQFVATKVHCMYILDPDQHPIGEVTHTDILNQILTL